MKGRLRHEPPDSYNLRLIQPMIKNGTIPNGLYVRLDRVGWTVHIIEAQTAKQVLTDLKRFPKADIRLGREDTIDAQYLGSPNVLFSNGAEWKKNRKIINPAFHRSMPVKAFAHLTQDMFMALEARMGAPIDAVDVMKRAALNVIGKVGFNFDFNALNDPDNPWVRMYYNIDDGIREPLFFHFPILDKYFLWMFPSRKAVQSDLKQFKQMLRQVISQRRQEVMAKDHTMNASEDAEKDLLTLMLESEKLGEGALTDEELNSNLRVFFLAGQATTANSLSFAVYHLSKNLDIQEKARQEAIEVLGDEPFDVLPTIEQVKKLRYIGQVIKETMRINTPVTQNATRRTTEDMELASVFIPKGTPVVSDIFDIHHNPNIWKDPYTFNPDRFSPNGEAEEHPSAWLPFGLGLRQCFGMNFSLTLQRVMLSMMRKYFLPELHKTNLINIHHQVRKFRWTLPDDTIHKDNLVTSVGDIPIALKLYANFEKLY
ncbi:cytochrome P450-dit2 [Apophysomyces ossiformis]|uniref:Cytochrome P450-dit2 n=1 Tax=Apophysomyces ossiformis TaxID=679940 RepID=A0A8H7EPH2_9FUNG|nr:cytochrome P450-dit2 [Apophysomyces ossiformis]